MHSKLPHRFQILALLTLALSMPWRAASADSPKPTAKPNILFILADDHRADGIAALGNPHIRTPNLDTLVATGTAFSHAYVFGSNTGAVCLPSRTEIVTGRSLYHLPAHQKRFAEVQKSHPELAASLLPIVLKGAGYETLHIGKGGNECT